MLLFEKSCEGRFELSRAEKTNATSFMLVQPLNHFERLVQTMRNNSRCLCGLGFDARNNNIGIIRGEFVGECIASRATWF